MMIHHALCFFDLPYNKHNGMPFGMPLEPVNNC